VGGIRGKAALVLALAALLVACSSADQPASAPAVGGSGGSGGIGASAGSTAAAGQSSGASGGSSGSFAGADAGIDAASDAGADVADAFVDACSELDPRSVPATLSVLPDAGEAPNVDVLKQAKSTIRVMAYMMGYGGVLDTLKQKAGSGVSVRVILDLAQIGVNQKYHDQLVAAGAQVAWSDASFTYMHAKVLIVDAAVAAISTGNYLVSNVLKERNYVVRNSDPADVADLVALFDADWQRTTPDLACTRLLISPLNARARILSLIEGAQSSLEIESMQLADNEVRAAVAAAKAKGIDVRVLLASPDWITANTAAAAFLAQHAIFARYLTTPSVHVKSIIVDGVRAFVGSENLSYTSLSKNREVGLILTEAPAVQQMVATFEQDWTAAIPF
jgi:cardiolipin synthase A/B